MWISFSRHSCYVLLFAMLDLIASLEMVNLHIPTQVLLGSRTTLLCNWTLAPNDTLYSVKWYKDGKEFFRHVPRDVEPCRKFFLPGVDVEKYNGSGSNLTLAPATLETSGRYRCEVSGERPRFHTVSEYADMLVIALPTEGPTITGFKSHYSLGDFVTVNCTSGRSRPAVHLAWYINGEPAPSMVSSLIPTVHNDENHGLEISSLGLDFKITGQHMMGDLKLKCLATLSPVYWRSVEESAVVSKADQDIAKENTPKAYSTSKTVKLCTDIFLLLVVPHIVFNII